MHGQLGADYSVELSVWIVMIYFDGTPDKSIFNKEFSSISDSEVFSIF